MDMNYSGLISWLETHTALVASIAGAACSAYLTEVKTVREKVACIVFGIITSQYLTDPIYHFLPILGEKTTCFLTGFFGLNICAAVLKSVRRFGDDADFWTLFREFAMNLSSKVGSVTGSDKPKDKE